MTPGGVVGLALVLAYALAHPAGDTGDTPGAGRPHSRPRGATADASSAVPGGWSATGSYLGARLAEAAAAQPDMPAADLAAAFGCSHSWASAARAVCRYQPALVADVIARRMPLGIAHRAAVAASRGGDADAARAAVLARCAQMRGWQDEPSPGRAAGRAGSREAA